MLPPKITTKRDDLRPRDEETFDRLVKSALLAEINGLPEVSRRTWEALEARILLEQNLAAEGFPATQAEDEAKGR